MSHGKPKAAGRYIFWGVIASLLGLFFVWAFMPSAIPVDVHAVKAGPMVVNVEAEARTQVKDIYEISAPVTGRLLRIEAEAGDPVVSGLTPLAVIEPQDPTILDRRSRAEAEANAQAAEDALILAQAGVDRAEAELRFARTELERAKKLHKNGTVSKRDYDIAILDVAKFEAQLNSAKATTQVRQHELETARARLQLPTDQAASLECCVVIRAPVNGQVLRIQHESEGVVAVGEALMEVGNPSDLEIVADLLTSDAALVRVGAPVVVENWGGPDLQGVVRRIDPFGYTKISVLGIEEQRVDVIIDLADPDNKPQELGHGFRVEVAIQTWQGDDVLQVPMSAMFRVDGGWGVYVMKDGLAHLAKLEVGHINRREAEVLSGLSIGDQVVLHPSDRITDGAKLVARDY